MKHKKSIKQNAKQEKCIKNRTVYESSAILGGILLRLQMILANVFITS